MKEYPIIQRDSSFELLRIFSQVFIVLYHMCLIWQGKELASTPFFHALVVPLHIGVIIFVLLSGYFTIKASSKGLVKFLGIFAIYNIIELVYNLVTAGNTLEFCKSLLFLSNSHFWFIKTYLFLFLVSPLINLWLDKASEKQRWYMVLVFFFVASYMALTKGDPSMKSGKNLVNFIFLYLVGNQLSFYKEKWHNISQLKLISAYMGFNICLFVLIFMGGGISKLVNYVSFPYSSPVLLFNAVLFFMITTKMKVQSRFVNYCASSSLAIYLIHACRPYMPQIHEYVLAIIQDYISNNILLTFCYLLYSIVVITFCIALDKTLTPVWNYLNRKGKALYNYLGY